MGASQNSEPAQSLPSGSGHAVLHQSVLLPGVRGEEGVQNDEPLSRTPGGQQRWRQQR